jgi:hypothetical protein
MVFNMHIYECFIQSKYENSTLCEDGIFHNDNFIAIIDGVTPKGSITWEGHTSGYYAKELIIKGLSELKGDETALETFYYLNELINKEYGERADLFLRNPEERLQATLVIYSVTNRQIWSFGDCQFIINDNIYADEMKIDVLLAEIRSVYLQLAIKQGKTIQELCEQDPSVDFLMPILKRQILFSNCNSEYGFSVLDGFCSDFTKLAVKDVPPNSLLVLASDGYPVLKSTLELSEVELENLRVEDPLCIYKYKSTRGWTNGKKSLDDRAYIRFKT